MRGLVYIHPLKQCSSTGVTKAVICAILSRDGSYKRVTQEMAHAICQFLKQTSSTLPEPVTVQARTHLVYHMSLN